MPGHHTSNCTNWLYHRLVRKYINIQAATVLGASNMWATTHITLNLEVTPKFHQKGAERGGLTQALLMHSKAWNVANRSLPIYVCSSVLYMLLHLTRCWFSEANCILKTTLDIFDLGLFCMLFVDKGTSAKMRTWERAIWCNYTHAAWLCDMFTCNVWSSPCALLLSRALPLRNI